MTLHINDPKFANERKDSKPLSMEEQKVLTEWLNGNYSEMSTHEGRLLFQRMLYHYENLQALSDFIGGWDGATRLMKIVDPMPGDDNSGVTDIDWDSQWVDNTEK